MGDHKAASHITNPGSEASAAVAGDAGARAVEAAAARAALTRGQLDAIARREIAGERLYRRLRSEESFRPGATVYTVVGLGRVDGSRGSGSDELLTLSFASASGVCSEPLAPEHMPLIHAYRSRDRALLLAKTIAAGDLHRQRPFNPMLAQLEVKPNGLSGRLTAIILPHGGATDTLPSEALPLTELLPESIKIEMVPENELVAEKFRDGRITGGNIRRHLRNYGSLYFGRHDPAETGPVEG